MTETVVHVTTLEQWKSVLDVWFKQGYKWNSGDTEYSEHLFLGHKYLVLARYKNDWNSIYCTDEVRTSIEYSDFMAQQEEDKEVKIYYVTQEQLDLIESVKRLSFPLTAITAPENMQKKFDATNFSHEKELLRYIGGDETIEFKVKEQLYRLWLIDPAGDKVYFRINLYDTPSSTEDKEGAFTAPLEEIKKWQTPAWEIEKAE